IRKQDLINDNKMKRGLNKLIFVTAVFALILSIFVSCKKDKYYYDSGVIDPHYSGTIMQYLESKPLQFDTLVQIIKLANLYDTLNTHTLTLFAPGDSSISRTIHYLDNYLQSSGKPIITNLDQIKPEIWHKYLAMYIFKDKKLLADYPQVDFQNLAAFPGGYFNSLDGQLMNIGVVYNSSAGVAYQGYRQLYLNYFPDLSVPYAGLITDAVASSDIQPTNGVIHALQFPNNYFGYDPDNFAIDAYKAGIDSL
ncbi:fasciclin domain-containing protein, partial [Arachidicoccus sp.]|uniref:fasciclin domain-containing protein n=1 Tax=Arachidicoccus sp. TaxID=1872624 RepID=UPI003D21A335